MESAINDQFLQSVIEISREAGVFIREESKKFSKDKIQYKGKNDLVSYVDKTAEKLLVEKLGELLPGSGFIAEENTSDKISDKYNWVIDPLDGTTNFIHGLPAYAVSVALMDNEEIVAGVVYEINLDECFSALKGSGAYCNGESIKVSDVTTLEDSLIATGFPYYDFGLLDAYLRTLKTFMQDTHGVRRLGSAATDLAYVAAGRFEGFFEYNLNAWDVAAGALLVKEAGGIVTDYHGGDDFINAREIIAAGSIHGQMREVILREWKK